MVAYEPELKSSIFISVVFALTVRSVSSDETNLHKKTERYQGDYKMYETKELHSFLDIMVWWSEIYLETGGQ